MHDLYDVASLTGFVIQLAALQPGVYKCLEANMCDYAGLTGGDIPKHLRNNALGKVVGGQFIFQRKLLKPGLKSPMTADHLCDETLLPQVIELPLLAVALTSRVEKGQVLGVSAAEVGFLNGLTDLLCVYGANEPRKGQSMAVFHISMDCFGGRHRFYHVHHPFSWVLPRCVSILEET